MTAFAGYYVAPEVWTAWMNSHPKRHRSAFGSSGAIDLIEESLRERNIGAYFGVQTVPVPPSVSTQCRPRFGLVANVVMEEPNYREGAFSIMIFRRRHSRRAYIPPRPDSKCDLTGRRILKRYIGLDVSRWRTLWFDEESYEAPYDAKFLKPKVRTERGDVNHKSGNGTRDKAETKTRSAAGSEEEGEDQGGEEGKENKDAQVEVGQIEGHKIQL
ncbi:hypothetical protein RSOL_429070 [Rhizoctonia solani AG-3 Rhs1AP]|uniref:Uncharacterized protein n=1 Tax=Rhizoctonia solani AG-3 Rhs1AP TaxID=1086054 RepID=X8JIM9_9AGAM|nr:hypothetical protein RSOL_429070 [Rhizoctonia solani AG-3 Rhs1AP]